MNIVPCEPVRTIRFCKSKKCSIRMTHAGIFTFHKGLIDVMHLAVKQTISICYDAEDKTKWYVKRGGKTSIHKCGTGSYTFHDVALFLEMIDTLRLDREKDYTFNVNPDWVEFKSEHYFLIDTSNPL
jgi:hypothetical protein